MSRKPAPPALRLLNGRAPGRDSAGRPVAASPGFVRLPPEPPELLRDEALEEWHRVVPELTRLNLTKPIDAAALTVYCLAWQRLCQAQAILDEEGVLHTTSQGRSKHPALMIAEAASKELRAWAGEFGLTPSAENRVSRPAAGSDDDNPFQ